jgi:hypothetical protein
MGQKRRAYRILVGKPEGKRPLGRPRSRGVVKVKLSLCLTNQALRVDNIKMDLREIGWDCMDWIDLAQDRVQWRALVNMVLNFWVP